MLTEIIWDVFDIASRIKEIEPSYFTVYNHAAKRFEVHSNRQGNTLCLCLPYPVLDARAVILVRKTRAERAKHLFEEMERENQKREREIMSKGMERLGEALG